MNKLEKFNHEQIETVTAAATLAEELVSNFYKISETQWLHRRYDIKTLKDLNPDEIVYGPFAQVIRFEGKKHNTSLSSLAYVFYKICLQDFSVLAALKRYPAIELFPFILYILTHELIHIVRFSNFLQGFHASPREKMDEEKRVHTATHDIIKHVNINGVAEVLKFYEKWRSARPDVCSEIPIVP